MDFYQAFYNDKDLQKARSMMADDLNNHHPHAGRIADGKIAEHWDVVQPVPDGVDPISMYD